MRSQIYFTNREDWTRDFRRIPKKSTSTAELEFVQAVANDGHIANATFQLRERRERTDRKKRTAHLQGVKSSIRYSMI